MDPLDEPILPFHSLAGIRLGEREEAVVARLGEPLRRRAGVEDRTFVEYPSIEFWSQHGAIYLIRASQGYRGATPEGLRVGASWKEVQRVYPTVAFDEDEGLWHVPGIDGLSFDIVRPPRAEELPILIPPWPDEWVDEEYEVLDPDHAFVLSIAVHTIRFPTLVR